MAELLPNCRPMKSPRPVRLGWTMKLSQVSVPSVPSMVDRSRAAVVVLKSPPSCSRAEPPLVASPPPGDDSPAPACICRELPLPDQVPVQPLPPALPLRLAVVVKAS